MMITKRMPETECDPFDLSAAGYRCFHCGQFLQDPAVMWKGNDEKDHQIHIHGDCLVDRVPRLMRDALELGYRGQACWKQLNTPPHG